MNITFLGAGVYGQALAKVARTNKHEVTFYDPYKYPDVDLESACRNAEAFVYVAPSSAAADLLPRLPESTPLICASKGFLSTKPFDRFITHDALAGATFAADLEHIIEPKRHVANPRHHSANTPLALTASLISTKKIFTTDWLTIEQARDFKGILLCGALKNVYAFGAGLLGITPADPAFAHKSPKQYHSTHPYLRAVSAEIQQILSANGAHPRTFTDHSCGFADLIITCTPSSRNFRAGRAIAEGKTSYVTPIIAEEKTPSTEHEPPYAVTAEALTILDHLPDDFILPASARLFTTIKNQYYNTKQPKEP